MMIIFVYRKTFIFLILIVVTFIFYFVQKPQSSLLLFRFSQISCYYHKTRSLPSILESDPPKNKSIFFHETSCNSENNGKIVINARQACAVESAAKLNPNFEIYLLYVSPGTIKDEGTISDRYLKALLSYKNVKIRHVDYGDYIEGTIVEHLWIDGILERSNYVHSHASDVLRYLTLWRYGGIYLDLDVIVVKSLEDLPLNYAGIESNELVAAGVLSLSTTGSGHVIAQHLLTDLKTNFNGQAWANNGPGVITRIAKNLCASRTVKDLVDSTCIGGFRVFPPKYFYPISWQNWSKYFDPKYLKEVEEATEESYVLHTWNHLSAKKNVSVKEEVALTVFARKYCPKVFSESDFF